MQIQDDPQRSQPPGVALIFDWSPPFRGWGGSDAAVYQFHIFLIMTYSPLRQNYFRGITQVRCGTAISTTPHYHPIHRLQRPFPGPSSRTSCCQSTSGPALVPHIQTLSCLQSPSGGAATVMGLHTYACPMHDAYTILCRPHIRHFQPSVNEYCRLDIKKK